ncbi:MAG TPA: hypothetical protein VG929_04110 [Actinomycetota bacterium]|nr:hypothetical protein [Actinomycetota bacterium]
MTAEVLGLTLLQTAAVLGLGRGVVSLVAPALGFDHRSLGPPERWLFAALGFVAFAIASMLIHIVSSGWWFGQRWPVPATAAIVAGIAARRSGARWVTPRVSPAVVVLAVVVVALYALPGIVGGSSLRTGDPPWHLGWTEQLLGGESRPEGPAPEPFARNAYPWGYHAALATMSRVVPGSDPVVAHEALQLLLVMWLPLSASCLARVVNPRAGLAGAAAFSLVGGFGWVRAQTPDFIESPLEARYGADLVVASPNSVYELLPPALPRELGLVLLACSALLVLTSMTSRSLPRAAAAGAAIGLVGVVSVPMLTSAVAWALAAAFVARRELSSRAVAVVAVAALATFALWAAPVAVDQLRYDGFVDVSPRSGVEWPIPSGLAAWGLLLPLAAAGVAVTLGQPPVLRRGFVAFAVAAAGLLLIAWLRQRSGWGVFANETALHHGRFWPPAHLVAGALAGVAITVGYAWLARRSVALAATTVGIVLAFAAMSPVFASVALTETIRAGEKGFLYGTADLQRGSFVRSAASVMDPDDVVFVEDDGLLGFYLWQFSGVRVANVEGTPEHNPWRIRYRSLAASWREAIEDRAIEPDWLVTTEPGAAEPVVGPGTFRDRRWVLVRPRG